ncbi:MAG: HPF/RaiA family ribosome-associated protein [Pirellulaceae bacterium]
MQVLVNTDNHITGVEELTQFVEAEVENTLGRFGPQLTRVEVYLSDENSHKSGDDDKRCVMEARLAGLPPIAARVTAATLEQAVNAASELLEKNLDRTLGRLEDRKGRTSYGGDQTI